MGEVGLEHQADSIMGRYEVTSPDGQRFEVTAPDDASQEDVLAFAQSQFSQPKPQPSMGAVAANAAAKGAASMLDAVPNTPTNLLNLGKAAYGAAAYGLGFKDIGDSITMSEPPNFAHRAGKSMGLIRPENEPQTAGQRILDTAVQGGVGLLIAPASGVKEVAKNVALGATSGAAAGATKEVTGSPLAAFAVGLLTPMATSLARKSLGNNEVLGETLKDGLEAGYVVPPSAIKPTFLGNSVESVAGKAAVKQEAAMRNQEVTNQLATKALGLPEGTPLTEGTLVQVREQAGKAYEAVAKIPVNQAAMPTPKDPAILLADLKDARFQASTMFKHYDRMADPASLKEAQSWSAKAVQLEKELEKVAMQAGQPELVTAMREARTQIAKSYDLERALNVGNGNVDARVIGRLLDQGKPLTGELKTIGRFAQAFPQVTREGSMVPAAGVSGTDAAASALLGTVGYGAAGGPAGLVAAGLPLLRGPARTLALSDMMQRRLLREPPTLYSSLLRGALSGRAVADAE